MNSKLPKIDTNTFIKSIASLFLCFAPSLNAQLRVDFQPVGHVTASGYDSFEASDNEPSTMATGPSETYSAYDSDVTVSITTDDPNQKLRIFGDRTGTGWGTDDLTRDCFSVDARGGQTVNFTLTIKGLPEGAYGWSSLHHDGRAVGSQTGPMPYSLVSSHTHVSSEISVTSTAIDAGTRAEVLIPYFSTDGSDISFNIVAEGGVLDFAILNSFEIRDAWGEPTSDSNPFMSSRDVTSCQLTGRYANYTDADTWYPSWGADDKMYSPFTDTIGNGVNGVLARSYGEQAVIGHATILGDDPLDLTIVNPGRIAGPANSDYQGRYPSASLHHDGVWYLGTYALANPSDYAGYNLPIIGGFAGFHISTDDGVTWTESPLDTTMGNSLFPEPTVLKGPVKLGSPHVVDFGKNMEHSPDGKMYLVAHGTTEMDGEDRQANASWITGDQIYLCRVVPSPETINDESQYEYYAGKSADGRDIWSDDFGDLKPIAEWDNHMGCVTITYNAPLRKFLMCVTDGWPTVGDMDTYILESDWITGPWKQVEYFHKFGPQAYFVNIPSKFISEDGRTAWLCYSANYGYRDIRQDPLKGNPVGSSYSMSLQEVNLQGDDSTKLRAEISQTDEGFVIGWNSLPGRRYHVQWSPDLFEDFEGISSAIEYPEASFMDTEQRGFLSNFYRVEESLAVYE